MDEITPKRPPASRNGRRVQRVNHPRQPPKREQFPQQTNVACWSVLDEPVVPARAQSRYREIPKPAPFYQTQGGVRPAGIPIIVKQVVKAREKGEEWFEDAMCQRNDRNEFLREKLLHRRAVTRRQFYSEMKDRTVGLARESGQEWVDLPEKRARSLRAATALAEKKAAEAISQQDIEAMAELAVYDEVLYQRKHKAQPTFDMEEFLEKRGIRIVHHRE
jgi:hypothetical protein